MPRVANKRGKLTLQTINRNPPTKEEGESFYHDTLSPLISRVSPMALRDLLVRTVVKGRGQIRITYPGDWPTTPADLDAARTWATKTHRAARMGADPIADMEREKREAEQVRGDLVSQVAEEFIKDHVKHLRRGDEAERIIRQNILPAIGDRRIGDLQRRDIAGLVRSIRAKGQTPMANRVLATARKMINWYTDEQADDSFRPPLLARLSKPETPRDRILTDTEIAAIWRATADPTPYNGIVRLLLLTGQRRGEVAGMERAEVTTNANAGAGLASPAANADWIIPAARHKGREHKAQPHLVPLSPAALAVIKAQSEKGKYVFSVNGKRPLAGFVALKAALDDRTGVTAWTLHDLRRTVRTRLSGLGVRPDIAERVIGHNVGGKIGATYDLHEYAAEKREALERWAAELATLVSLGDL